jgi:hypothetical protein
MDINQAENGSGGENVTIAFLHQNDDQNDEQNNSDRIALDLLNPAATPRREGVLSTCGRSRSAVGIGHTG